MLAILAVLLLGACGGGGAQPPAAQAPAVERADLAFTVPTLDGGTFDGASLAGRPAVLWFWAPWCSTCHAEAPGINALVAEHGSRLAVVGVAGLDEVSAMHQFVQRTGVQGVLHLVDESGEVWRRFGVREQSSYVLLTADGTVAHRGFLDERELAQRVAELLG